MNHTLLRSLCTLVSLAFVSLASAAPQSLSPELAALKPTPLLATDVTASIKFSKRPEDAKPATFQRVEVPGAASAFRVETFGRSDVAYSVEAKAPIQQPVKKGDICLARFAVRAISAKQESGEASFGCYFQQTSEPFEKSVTVQLSAGPEWTTYNVPFDVSVDAAVGASALYFSFGLLEQVVEFKDVEVLNFGQSITLDKLPATRFSYAGREAGAAWRTKALERIEQIRTAPINIIVTDNAGKPVEGARVDVKMVQSDFIWGSAMETNSLIGDSPDNKIYREKAAELFNTITIANGLKWQPWMNAGRRADTVRAMDWIEAQGLRLRGHNLIWPGWRFSPKRLQTLPNPAVELPRQIETRIEDAMTATKGRTIAWDVLNEPVHERDFYTVFPESTSAEWFKQARRLDPKTLLFVNEYAMLNSRSSPDFIKRYLAFIQMLKDNGAPLDGIGVQGHIGGRVRNPTDVLSDLDLLQAANLPINITEFDINTKDEELQADYTRDFLIACYSHPSVSGFIMWGFWQKDHWKPDAAMFRADWSEKPNAKAYRDLVLNQWRTQFDATTNAGGAVAGRGHLGTYEITVTKGTSVLKHTMQLTRDRDEIRLTLQTT